MKTNRQIANQMLVEILAEYLVKYPNIRFSQALFNLNIVIQNGHGNWLDDYYVEPSEILNRIGNKQNEENKE